MKQQRAHVLVCAGAACVSSGCKAVKTALVEELEKHQLAEEVKVIETGCVGSCDLGPIAIIYPEGTLYCKLKPEDMGEVVNEHLLKGRVVERLLFQEPGAEEVKQKMTEMAFFKDQHQIVLSNTGKIDPAKIEEYIARDGYAALGKALTEMTPDQVIEEILNSGLRGRGGAGFKTGLKWKFARQAKGTTKFVVCNADEGDPGAFMDRSIIEGDPHRLIEAMTLAGYAIGAQQGYVYVRAEYPLAVERLSVALGQAREYGLLGKNIFETDFNFELEIRVGAGAFVCGEETALMNSIMGLRGMPNPRPPYPTDSGLWGCPTVLNNVETYANVPPIVLNGADWYNKIGTETSKGTKVFALAGDINNTGLVEVPMGTSLKDIIYKIGGGIRDGKKFKAAQTGGPSGGCIPAEKIDVQIDYESLKELGSMMGSGGLIVMDENTCMVDLARFFMEFICEESCGKCIPCREGTRQMLDILIDITRGDAEEEDLKRLEELAYAIKDTALCGLGQSAPNPVLSTMHYFRDEYLAHVNDKHCPAGVCRKLVRYEIQADECRGCTLCTQVCPTNAISGERKQVHIIDQEACIKCGACYEKCPFDAITKK